jgi:sodium transport system permease protein
MIPTIELDFALACVPILNAALALRAVFTAGGAALPWAEIAIIFATTALLAAAAIAWCAWWFGRERVIFRS